MPRSTTGTVAAARSRNKGPPLRMGRGGPVKQVHKVRDEGGWGSAPSGHPYW